MQKGFSLTEMLIVSLFGSLLLAATSQALVTLIKYQTDQSELLRLAENAILTEMALKQILGSSTEFLIIGKAISNYPARAPKKTSIQYNNQGNTTEFNQFSSSDWLILFTIENNYGLFHLDKKSYGYGLAYKKLKPEENTNSNTLANQVELIRFRYLPDEETQNNYCLEQQLITIKKDEDETEVEGTDCSAIEANIVRGIELAFILVTSRPIKKPSPSSFSLWGETLIPPKDGLYRKLVTLTLPFPNESTTPLEASLP